jgi:hypothetical protein
MGTENGTDHVFSERALALGRGEYLFSISHSFKSSTNEVGECRRGLKKPPRGSRTASSIRTRPLNENRGQTKSGADHD